jgi:hypothetical protein
MMDTQGKFYLGRIFDTEKGQTTDNPFLYDPDDLTTHAFVVGMTGSGKTGLCIDLLEEAALNGLPALMIDPKGDITNMLLHFPELLPSDFQPWVNVDQARRSGQTLEEAGKEAADLWRNGLASWDITPERLRALEKSVHFAIYTPGSDAGIPVNILASLKAPEIAWEDNRELLREKISSTATALLGLVGLTNIDPVRSREHILLANIFENAWSQGRDLTLSELIMQTQSPPFAKLGVFDVNTFFPEKDRFGLAMLLNNILAAPAFQTWIEGQPLDIPSLLFGPDGRPRHSVFYIAHLSDAERMFFTTLLFSAVETWMRAQSGAQSLRALLYFDEIFGYLPPVANPPSKEPMLRMLKQARAFGVGLVLVTQNPVDVDYKALSNMGTWFIGKLQTDQDKQRLLDGLQGAVAGNMDRAAYDRLISTLGKRVFLAHNIHNKPGKEATLFQTRWAMNYLTGPLARTQIPALNQMVGAVLSSEKPSIPASPAAKQTKSSASASPAVQTPAPAPVSGPDLPGTLTQPALPSSIQSFYLPNNLSFTQAFKAAGASYPPQADSLGMLYRPVLLAQAHIRFINRKYNLDHEKIYSSLIPNPDRRGVIRWDDFSTAPIDPGQLDDRPDPRARFSIPESPLSDAKLMSSIQKDFLDWVYRSSQVTVRANEALKVYAGPETSQADFRKLCAQAAQDGRDAEIDKISTTYDKKIASLQEKIRREERELNQDESEFSQRKLEELGTHAENLLGLFSGRKSSRRLSSSLSRRRMTEKAKADVKESEESIQEFEKQIAALEKEKTSALEDTQNKWAELANQITEIPITPYKKDILLDLFGLAWYPYFMVQTEQELSELPGFQAS